MGDAYPRTGLDFAGLMEQMGVANGGFPAAPSTPQQAGYGAMGLQQPPQAQAFRQPQNPYQQGQAGYGQTGVGGMPVQNPIPAGTDMFGNSMTRPAGGWAGGQGLSNEAMAQYLFDDPSMLLTSVLPGIDPFGPGYARMADLPVDPNLLYALAQYGAGGGAATSGPDQFANYLNQLYTGIGGGQWFDFNSILGMLNAPGSELDWWLSHADPKAVQGFLKQTLAAAAQGLDPFGQNLMFTMMPGMFAGQNQQLLQSTPMNRGQIQPMDAFNAGLAEIGL